eukprot:TRINITY_DN24204_c0_g1_i1.p1 TRINITY_DN24204_c0_g1~~TRINITY_DN24204_c0_g1_i1.p1  ORF type:complete len:431 (+),score=66.86 TRINITY_DN24204_c0_g1_i1:89-1381(+)
MNVVPKHIIFSLEEGSSSWLYTWGNNLKGQLGLGSKKPIINEIQRINLNNKHFLQITTGSHHSLVVTISGSVYSWGSNDMYQLGYNCPSFSPVPHAIGSLSNISSICCGAQHSMAVDTRGVLYGWGSNHSGQLGLENIPQRAETPRVIPLPEPVMKVSAGLRHSLAVSIAGHLYAWGDNSHGQLGLKDCHSSHSPKKLDISGVVDISCGDDFTIALLNDGTVYSWGNNQSGKLGIGTTLDSTAVPQKIEFQGENGNIVQVHCQAEHAMALSAYGRIYAWGSNKFGQLGVSIEKLRESSVPIRMESFDERVAEIHCEDKVSMFVTRSGLINYFGKYSCGELGIWGKPHSITQFKSKKVSFMHNPVVALREKILNWPVTHHCFSVDYQTIIENLMLVFQGDYHYLLLPKDILKKISITILYKIYSNYLHTPL